MIPRRNRGVKPGPNEFRGALEKLYPSNSGIR
jgi:hypothetical protein